MVGGCSRSAKSNSLDFALRGKADLFDEPLDRRRNGLVAHGASPNRGSLDEKKL